MPVAVPSKGASTTASVFCFRQRTVDAIGNTAGAQMIPTDVLKDAIIAHPTLDDMKQAYYNKVHANGGLRETGCNARAKCCECNDHEVTQSY